MAAKKKAAGPVAPEPQDIDLPEADDAATGIDPSAISGADRRFIARTFRFLLGIHQPQFLARAKREGYTADEHRQGWLLVRTAGGDSRHLDQFFEEVGAGGATTSEQLASLQELDAFENLWFPRARAIIRRAVPAEHRDLFAASFFKDLDQQPLGPAVVGSVATFVARVESLATSAQPGAKQLLAMLRTRGLNEVRLAKVKATLAEMQELGAIPARPVSVDEVSSAQTRQREAVAALRDWFNDWATTLRPLFTAREQIALGLAVVTRGKGGAEEIEDEAPAGAAGPPA